MPDPIISGEVKILADERHAGFAKPFVAVAYDLGNYAALRPLSPSLPDLNAEDFKSRAVIVVFLGQRPTSGYSIGVNPNGEHTYLVSESKPPEGMMVMQVLTSPLKVVSVPVAEGTTLTLQIRPECTVGAEDFRVAKGEFSSTGGFAARQTKFNLAGSIKVLRHDEFVTFIFDVNTTGIKSSGRLHTVASGTVDKEGKITLSYVDPGTLVPSPYAPLRAEGSWTEAGLSLNFASLRPTVADGFTGKGSLEAKAMPSR